MSRAPSSPPAVQDDILRACNRMSWMMLVSCVLTLFMAVEMNYVGFRIWTASRSVAATNRDRVSDIQRTNAAKEAELKKIEADIMKIAR